MADVYQIVDWDQTFEKASSRIVNNCSYVCMPNKHHSMGLLNLLEMDEGPFVLGIYHLIVQFCSRQKAPRHGWLTTNGQKDGRPVPIMELARLFRRSKEEIEHCLQVCSQEDIGWIKKYSSEELAQLKENAQSEASHEHAHGTPIESHESAHGTPMALHEHAHGWHGQAMSAPMPTIGIMERKGIERNEDARARENQICENENLKTENIKTDNAMSAPSASHEHAHGTPMADDAKQQVQEAKRVLGLLSHDVFGEKLSEIWPNDIHHSLIAAMPITGAELELINWFYRLPVRHEIFSVTRRKQSFPRLVENLRGEVQKIKSARQQIGLNGATVKPVEEVDDWPPNAREVAFDLWGEKMKLPRQFKELPASAQTDLKAALAHRGALQ